jgi:hypothetical protein
MIMTGKPISDYNDLKIEFGTYAQVFEDNDPTNTVKARTTEAIALTPTGNAQGGYHFLLLGTGRKLSRKQWDTLPMPDRVITAVEHMAEDEQQPLVGHGEPLFEWSPGVAIEDNEQGPILQDEHEPIGAIEVDDKPEEDKPFYGKEPDDPEEGDIDKEIKAHEAHADEVYVEEHRSESNIDSEESAEGADEPYDKAEPYIEDHRSKNGRHTAETKQERDVQNSDKNDGQQIKTDEPSLREAEPQRDPTKPETSATGWDTLWINPAAKKAMTSSFFNKMRMRLLQTRCGRQYKRWFELDLTTTSSSVSLV